MQHGAGEACTKSRSPRNRGCEGRQRAKRGEADLRGLPGRAERRLPARRLRPVSLRRTSFRSAPVSPRRMSGETGPRRRSPQPTFHPILDKEERAQRRIKLSPGKAQQAPSTLPQVSLVSANQVQRPGGTSSFWGRQSGSARQSDWTGRWPQSAAKSVKVGVARSRPFISGPRVALHRVHPSGLGTQRHLREERRGCEGGETRDRFEIW